jgi:DNA (cytosine-5)-methyltransferase 1
MRVVGLFSGIGGIELGLERAGHVSTLLCENDPSAVRVLERRFSSVELVEDIRKIDALPSEADLVAGGFPCQDLSQAGETRGIRGSRSGLVDEVFRLLKYRRVPWVLLENVPFMLRLGRGTAMRHIVDRFEDLGYSWAYRVLDSQAFGLPQRRQRVFLLASLEGDPARVLHGSDKGAPKPVDHNGRACGFYWTEGRRGLGWAVDSVPTLKGGSTIGIPSPPAIWMPDGRIVTPDIRDAERLQGFRSDWTRPAEDGGRPSLRWKLIGNAVSVPVAKWVGDRLAKRDRLPAARAETIPLKGAWPVAAFGSRASGRYAVRLSTWPVRRRAEGLADFLRYEPKVLSHKATSGFARRLRDGSLRAPDEFRAALDSHIARESARLEGTRR